MNIDRTRALEAFHEYVEPYGTVNPRIALKIKHTYRVAALCDTIARSEGLSSGNVDLAWLCGLLHDIGRFEQLHRWNTFNDAQSVDHARLGVNVLFETEDDEPGNIHRFMDERYEDPFIRAAVGAHSAFSLPPKFDARTRLFCNIVRDADKVDILRTVCESSVDTILGVNERTFRSSRISDDALRAFRKRRCLAREERHEPADYLVGLVSFAFELVFRESRHAMAAQGYLFRVLDAPFGIEQPFFDLETQELWDRMGDTVRVYLAQSR